MSEYRVLDLTAAYEIGARDGRIIAACICGQGADWPDKGLGRASAATWRTRHQDCAEATQ